MAGNLIPRWEKIRAIVPNPGDSDAVRRARLAGVEALAGLNPTHRQLTALLSAAMGSVFVAVEYISANLALINVPDASYPFGTPNAIVPWSSTVAHVLVRTQAPTGMTEGQFYATAGLVVSILDPIVPAWVTFDWYRPGPVFAAVLGGPSATCFYLDDPHNLDNEIFGEDPPTLTAISLSLGDTIASKYSDVTIAAPIVLTGTNLGGAISVLFGATAATVYTIDSAKQITVYPPGHVAGSISVTVSNSGFTSNALSYEYWSPYTLAPSAFWDGSRINSSAIGANRWSYNGWSGAVNSVLGVVSPVTPDLTPGCPYFLSDGSDGDVVGSGWWSLRSGGAATTLRAYPAGVIASTPDADITGYATFVRSHGDGMYFSNTGGTMSNLVGTGACTVAMVIDINGAVQAQATDANANALFNDANLKFGIMLGGASGNQLIFLYWDGTATRKASATLPVLSGRLVILARRTAAGVLQLSFDGITWTSGDTCTGLLAGAGFPAFGTNILNPTVGYFDGRLRALSTWATDLSDANAQKFVAWAAARHP